MRVPERDLTGFNGVYLSAGACQGGIYASYVPWPQHKSFIVFDTPDEPVWVLRSHTRLYRCSPYVTAIFRQEGSVSSEGLLRNLPWF